VRRLKSNIDKSSDEAVHAELLERCKQGDEMAWNELVQSTHREVYTLCFRILGNADDAADATQDAYLKVWRGLGGFRGDALFSTWLYRVATNAALSKRRSRQRRRSHESEPADEVLAQIASSASVEEAAGARFEVRVLEKALASLPEMYRDAVVLRDVYGLSIGEIARQMKVSETAAKVRVHRGRKRLREMVFSEESSP
jgi:RNA polymerase sigma-70 factor (ECF subfamily)